MGFVQAGFLAALGAIAIPILIHLVMGRRGRRVDLGTLRFLTIAFRENVRRRRVKRWLLLAMRILCLVLLALLFARPYIMREVFQTNERLVMLLVDRSASMDLRFDGERLLDRAVREAAKILAECGPLTRVELAWFDNEVHPFRPLHAPDKRQPDQATVAAEFLASLKSSTELYSSTDYGAAMAWARDSSRLASCTWMGPRGGRAMSELSGLLDRTRRWMDMPPRLARKELYVLTDLQRSGLNRTVVEAFPEDVEVQLIDVGRMYSSNVAITDVSVAKSTPRPREPVSVRATVFNFGSFPLKTVPVVLDLRNGAQQRRMRDSVDVDAGAAATVVFEFPRLSEGRWRGHIDVEADDDLSFDNRRHFALEVSPQIYVTVIDGDPGRSPLDSETFFLEAALRLAPTGEDVFVDSPFQPEVATLSKDGALPELGPAKAIVLANVPRLNANDEQRLTRFVIEGGGLLVFTGDHVQPDPDKRSSTAGISVGRIVGSQIADALPWRLTEWDDDHPLLRPFADPQHGDLQRLAFRSYTRIEPDKGVEVLARFRDGGPAILERQLGRGKILWFACACDLDMGDWPRSRLFAPIIHQMLAYLTGLAEGGPVREVSIDDAGISSKPGVVDRGTYLQVVNTTPSESETDRCTPEEFAAHFHVELMHCQASLDRLRPQNRPDKSGHYEHQPRQSNIDGALATHGEERSSGPAAVAGSGSQMRPDEVWHWIVLLLLGCLLAEAFLANRTFA